MKTNLRVSHATLAMLFATLAPLALGCASSPGDGGTESTHEALANNNNNAPDRKLEDLKKDGYDCGPIDGAIVCTKDGSPTYYCYSNGTCTAGFTTSPKPPIVRLPPGSVAPVEGF